MCVHRHACAFCMGVPLGCVCGFERVSDVRRCGCSVRCTQAHVRVAWLSVHRRGLPHARAACMGGAGRSQVFAAGLDAAAKIFAQSHGTALVPSRRVMRKRFSCWSELVFVAPSRTHLVKRRDVGLVCVPGEDAGDACVPAPCDPEALVGPLF